MLLQFWQEFSCNVSYFSGFGEANVDQNFLAIAFLADGTGELSRLHTSPCLPSLKLFPFAGYDYLMGVGLGRCMQEAPEAEHLDKDKMAENSFQGGNFGNPWLEKSKGEDGRWHYNKNGPRKEMKVCYMREAHKLEQHVVEEVGITRLIYLLSDGVAFIPGSGDHSMLPG
jgi:hypothetical protein